jgi:hypothetical protein
MKHCQPSLLPRRTDVTAIRSSSVWSDCPCYTILETFFRLIGRVRFDHRELESYMLLRKTRRIKPTNQPLITGCIWQVKAISKD